MFHAHKLVATHGLDKARHMTQTKAQRACVDAAWMIMNDMGDRSTVYASRVVTSLPHKRGSEIDFWEQDTGRGKYSWASGGPGEGLPFGSKSRMILIHILNEAISSRSPRVNCGRTLYEWNYLTHNKSVGGMTYNIILSHAKRIMHSKLSMNNSGMADFQSFGMIVKSPDLIENNREKILFNSIESIPNKIDLDEVFYNHLIENSIPLRLNSLQLINNNSSAIDLYIRLSDGLPRLNEMKLATWSELKKRFGAGYKNLRQMKPVFLDTLSLVCAVYPEANIEVVPEGVILYPSKSAAN